MQATLTIIRYRKRYTYFALVAMALHRLPLLFNENISFYKLLGSGKNGSFDIHPDWQQWGIFAVHKQEFDITNLKADNLATALYGSFIGNWLRYFNCETWTIFLEPLTGHGSWSGKQPFGSLPKNNESEGMVAVLTRAGIRLSKLKSFWKNVDGVSEQVKKAEGFITSFGVGELPLIRQATFSIWQSMELMKKFAYQSQQHTEVIQKTRARNWYREEMFVRFKIVKTIGTISGKDPLSGKL